jgi:phenylalanyl-tRNA synthetase beta chain
MNISLKWLKSYVEIPKEISAEELAERITMSVVEVDGFVKQADSLEGIVVAQIKEINKHPDADKLQVCSVDTGKKGSFKVVCGGNNLQKDMIVPLAMAGSKVKWHGEGDLVTLEKVKVRGVESEGMICAVEEIGLAKKYIVEGGIADLELDESFIGKDISEALGLDDIIFEIDNKSLTNRPDLWGHYGIARELSALLDVRFKPLIFSSKLKIRKKYKLNINIEDRDTCRRYLGIIIDNIKVGSSPDWLAKKIESVGVKSINNIVDITNFVMLEMGQPLHAFDLRDIKDNKIIVRKAKAEEKFITLDEEERKLTVEDLLICDGEKGVALAGVMGGLNSEIKDDTTRILIESANFEPTRIRKTSVRTGLRTESSARFEKNLDVYLAKEAILRAIELVQQLNVDSIIASKLIDRNYSKQDKIKINLDLEFVNKKIGQVIPKKKIINILSGLGFGVKEKKSSFTKNKGGKNDLEVEVPSYRSTGDINIPEDLIEEIARIYGYDNIQIKNPKIELTPSLKDKVFLVEKNLRDFMSTRLAYNEVYNYSMVSEDDIHKIYGDKKDYIGIKNTVSKNLKYLRNSLLIGFLNNASDNLRYFKNFKSFEIGRVFNKEHGDFKISKDSTDFLPSQDKMLAFMAVGEYDFLDFKGDLESMLNEININYTSDVVENILFVKEQILEYFADRDAIGVMGKIDGKILSNFGIDSEVFYAEFNVSKFLKYIKNSKNYQPLSKYPKMIQDISMIVSDSVRWQDVEQKINAISSLITEVELFDIYEAKEEEKKERSLAFHITFHDLKKTLTSKEVDKLMKQVKEMLVTDFKVKIK